MLADEKNICNESLIGYISVERNAIELLNKISTL